MPSAPIAALDLGSNTFRLMLAADKGGAWAGKRVFQALPRLSEGLRPGGRFKPEALARTWPVLENFAAEIRAAGAEKVLAGAAMAARLASDGPDFMAEIAGRYGWETFILSGEEEAGLTARGALTGLIPCPPEVLLFDLGGRSTEFIVISGGRIGRGRSLNLGAVGLTEDYSGPPARPERLTEAIKAALAGTDFSDVPASAVLAGTAGTVTSIAAVLLNLRVYDPALINNARLTRDSLVKLAADLAPLSAAERTAVYGLHPRRADALPAGLALILEIMDHFGRSELLVSDNGLLEGIWLRAAAEAILTRPLKKFQLIA